MAKVSTEIMSSRTMAKLLVVALAISLTLQNVSGFGLVSPPAHLSFTGRSSSSSNGNTRLTIVDGGSSTASSTTLHMAQRKGRPKGPLRTIETKPTMNDEIQYDTLRVTTPGVDKKGGGSKNMKDEALGIMSKEEALAKAQELGGLDLILINENSDPPVCKIVDYSKYRYMKEKKAKELKKNAKASEVKEVKMSYKIDVHDYDVRKKNAAKFITQGNRVKCTVMFRGREIQHDNLGKELLQRLADDLGKLCVMDVQPKREGRNLSCFISPKPEVLKAISDRKRAGEKAARKKKEQTFQAMMDKEQEKEATSVAAVTDLLANTDDDELSLDDILGSISDDSDSDDLDDLLEGDELTDDLFG